MNRKPLDTLVVKWEEGLAELERLSVDPLVFPATRREYKEKARMLGIKIRELREAIVKADPQFTGVDSPEVRKN